MYVGSNAIFKFVLSVMGKKGFDNCCVSVRQGHKNTCRDTQVRNMFLAS